MVRWTKTCGTRQVLRYCPCHQGAGKSEGAVAPLWSRCRGSWCLNWAVAENSIGHHGTMKLVDAWSLDGGLNASPEKPMLDRGTRWGLPENDHICWHIQLNPHPHSPSITFSSSFCRCWKCVNCVARLDSTACFWIRGEAEVHKWPMEVSIKRSWIRSPGPGLTLVESLISSNNIKKENTTQDVYSSWVDTRGINKSIGFNRYRRDSTRGY